MFLNPTDARKYLKERKKSKQITEEVWKTRHINHVKPRFWACLCSRVVLRNEVTEELGEPWEGSWRCASAWPWLWGLRGHSTPDQEVFAVASEDAPDGLSLRRRCSQQSGSVSRAPAEARAPGQGWQRQGGNGRSRVSNVRTLLKVCKSSLFRLPRNRPRLGYSWFWRQLVSGAVTPKITFSNAVLDFCTTR